MMPRVNGMRVRPACGRGLALDDLQVQRQRREAAEHAQADHRVGGRAHRERAVPEQVQRQDRVGLGVPLGQQERPDAEHTDHVAGHRAGRVPAPDAALLGDHQQRHQRDDERERARVVDLVVDAPQRGQVQHAGDDDDREDADGHVDEEHPPPARDPEDRLRAREEPADDGAEHRRGAEDGEEVALVAGALPGGDEVAEDRDRERHEATRAEALHAAVDRQLVHRVRGAGQQRADHEDRDRDQVQRLAAVDVGELAVQRRRDRGRQQVGGGHPRLQGQAVQVVADGPDGRRDDRLVERGEEHAEHEPAEDGEDLAVRRGDERLRFGGGRGGGLRGHRTFSTMEIDCAGQLSRTSSATTVHPRCVPRHADVPARRATRRINASARRAVDGPAVTVSDAHARDRPAAPRARSRRRRRDPRPRGPRARRRGRGAAPRSSSSLTLAALFLAAAVVLTGRRLGPVGAVALLGAGQAAAHSTFGLFTSMTCAPVRSRRPDRAPAPRRHGHDVGLHGGRPRARAAAARRVRDARAARRRDGRRRPRPRRRRPCAVVARGVAAPARRRTRAGRRRPPPGPAGTRRGPLVHPRLVA